MNKLDDEIICVEVKQVIFQMSHWKAPGPNGFPVGFYQKSWNIVYENVCNYITQLWSNPDQIHEINQTEIFIIPKILIPTYV